MGETKREGEKFAGCGYGLLGLCCSACLLGPCRLSPFEKESARGLCGDDRDLIVSKNLLRLAIGGAVEEMKSLKETILKSSAWNSAQLSEARSIKAEKGLTEKYGFSSNISKKELTQLLVEKSKNLLSPFPKDTTSFLLSQYPEEVYPHLYRENFLSGSLTSFLLDSIDFGQKESSGIEGILYQCLRISLLALTSEGLRHDISHLIDGENLSDMDERAFGILESLPPNPSPVVILLSGEDGLYREFISRMADEFGKRLKEVASIISIEGVGFFPNTGRRLFEKWSLSVPEMSVIVLIASKTATSILGALALGFTVTSFPPLPIHGSGRVEKFFFEDLRNKFGNAYLLSMQSEISSNILEFLRRKE